MVFKKLNNSVLIYNHESWPKGALIISNLSASFKTLLGVNSITSLKFSFLQNSTTFLSLVFWNRTVMFFLNSDGIDLILGGKKWSGCSCENQICDISLKSLYENLVSDNKDHPLWNTSPSNL